MPKLERCHIPAGTSYVARAKPMVVSAALGTCVGVALFDTKNRVGGVIHLLLPEPVSSESVLYPEKYATTAMPVFIQSILNEGASHDHLQAVIAGGALVGPLMPQDLSLDIGGRTAEIVQTILKKAGIPIVKSETGGFFTCRLSLNLMNFQTKIEPLFREPPPSADTPEVPSLAEITRAMDRIAPIPQVALKILRLVDEDDYGLDSIAEEVRKDQVICAKTLQLANSALFSRGRRIETLDDALILLGQDLLVQLVVSVSVKGFFHIRGQGYSLCKGGLFHHALGAAQVAAILAAKAEKTSVALAYTAGLLHDIGKVVLDQFITTVYPFFYRNLQDPTKSVMQTEAEIFGIHHAQIGFLLAQRWEFPDSLIQAIRHHHEPENEEVFFELTHILNLADLLITRFHPGLELEQMQGHHLEARLQKIGLSVDQLLQIVDALPPHVFHTSPNSLAEVA
jgi:putative nucleotidyltransferase with HDIG domain